MICKPCADAADGKTQGPTLPHCPTCGRQIAIYSPGGKVVAHKRGLERCPGGPAEHKPVWTGHERCKGCSCQHKSSGSWNHDR